MAGVAGGNLADQVEQSSHFKAANIAVQRTRRLAEWAAFAVQLSPLHGNHPVADGIKLSLPTKSIGRIGDDGGGKRHGLWHALAAGRSVQVAAISESRQYWQGNQGAALAAPSFSAAPGSGRVKQKTLPFPSSLSTVISPP